MLSLPFPVLGMLKASSSRQVDEEVARFQDPSLQFHEVLWMLRGRNFPYVDREYTGFHLPSLSIHRVLWIRYVDREEGTELQLPNLQIQEFL
jgi:hypothetical protein